MTQSYPWFAMTVKLNREKSVAQCLRYKGLEDYLPLYKARRQWSDRVQSVELPLFPGYIFCRFDYHRRLPVLTTPGVNSIVGFGGDPAPVSESEIDDIKMILASGLPARPWPFIRVGQRVRIERGSLAGLEGILLREKGAVHVVVSVELLSRSVAVEIDRDVLCAVHSSPSAEMTSGRLTA
jgi:transcription antitermination factor NusG